MTTPPAVSIWRQQLLAIGLLLLLPRQLHLLPLLSAGLLPLDLLVLEALWVQRLQEPWQLQLRRRMFPSHLRHSGCSCARPL